MSAPQPKVRFLPLGGLGEVGMNCFVLEADSSLLIVDAGAGFPDDDWGVDLIHPDFSWLWDRREQIVGVVITHGHEDHIGALPFLLREFEQLPPVYAPPHAAALIRQRLAEHDLPDEQLFEMRSAEQVELGPFRVEPVPVSHSIIDAMALIIETPAGRIIHTGDFDLETEQPAAKIDSESRFRLAGEQGVRLLLSDSTNVDLEQRPGSELEVAATLQELVLSAQHRVIVSLFASNVHRLKVLVDLAQRSGRKLCLLGRSLSKHLEIAKQLGRLQVPSSLLIAPEHLDQTPRSEVLILAGGSQAETGSALRRLSLDTHQFLRLEAGDRVILSSRVIPGNERAVFTMENDLLRLGVELRNRHTDPGIHTSGHASRAEQRKMLEWVRPECFVPVHGTLHHLLRHAELARQMGVEKIEVVENGACLRLSEDGLEKAGFVPHGKIRIAYGGEELEPSILKRRAELGRNGVCTVALQFDHRMRLLGEPSFSAFGVPTVDFDSEVAKSVRREVKAAAEPAIRRRELPSEESIRRAVRRVIFDFTGTRPVVEVHLSQLEAL